MVDALYTQYRLGATPSPSPAPQHQLTPTSPFGSQPQAPSTIYRMVPYEPHCHSVRSPKGHSTLLHHSLPSLLGVVRAQRAAPQISTVRTGRGGAARRRAALTSPSFHRLPKSSCLVCHPRAVCPRVHDPRKGACAGRVIFPAVCYRVPSRCLACYSAVWHAVRPTREGGCAPMRQPRHLTAVSPVC
jgi:hypothetical protein